MRQQIAAQQSMSVASSRKITASWEWATCPILHMQYSCIEGGGGGGGGVGAEEGYHPLLCWCVRLHRCCAGLVQSKYQLDLHQVIRT